DVERYREKLEVLDGSRAGGLTAKAAVRLEDLSEILKLPTIMKSTPAAGSTPTKAEYDALRADVMEIFKKLDAIRQALQAKLTS
ncbi:hypothetical protein, partial [Aerococcus mictus]|uniref:hypothetical protein n=1 Tax=Aerococcus mictus TaxID=2976810 RepID=UPI001C655D22